MRKRVSALLALCLCVCAGGCGMKVVNNTPHTNTIEVNFYPPPLDGPASVDIAPGATAGPYLWITPKVFVQVLDTITFGDFDEVVFDPEQIGNVRCIEWNGTQLVDRGYEPANASRLALKLALSL